ncbi:MAG: TRAP transporter large permease subunit [Deltaproteobacteria bacterium]|nr:TRAP transporter large permease subunit [Deltaproteobacteria bacterium]
MEWWQILAFLIGGLLFFLALGLPIAFSFLLINFIGAYVFMGGMDGLSLSVQQIFTSLVSFSLAPIPLFVFMGELMLHSGMAKQTLDVFDKLIGKLPGRLSLIVITGGALFSTLSGSTIANTAMLGEIMVPEMKERGYKNPMILGPIVGVGGLAMLIPPSALAVVYASLAQISVGKVLIAGAVPGFMLAVLYSLYVVGRSRISPSLAPAYEVARHTVLKKLSEFAKYVLPLGFIFFLVLGFIFLGVATPTEAASTGALGSIVLACCYRKFSLAVLQKSLGGTLRVSVMAFMIIAASKTYSSIQAFTGSTIGLVNLISDLQMPRLVVLIAMMLILMILGTFMEQVSMMMITIPIYMPVIQGLGYDPIWFAILILLNLEMAMSTPPFGILLFVMKGSAPVGTKMGEICLAAAPFLICDLIVMIILISFPSTVLFLPGLM